jgi:hypothetical protein
MTQDRMDKLAAAISGYLDAGEDFALFVFPQTGHGRVWFHGTGQEGAGDYLGQLRLVLRKQLDRLDAGKGTVT